MTKRCKYCGTKMAETEIDGKSVYQCPICGYVEEQPEAPAVAEAAEEDTA